MQSNDAFELVKSFNLMLLVQYQSIDVYLYNIMMLVQLYNLMILVDYKFIDIQLYNTMMYYII